MLSWLRSFFSPSVQQSFLVIDIGTAFIKVLVCSLEAGEVFVHGAAKVRQRYGDMTAGSIADIAAVSERVETAVGHATRLAGMHPRTALFGLGGELMRGSTQTLFFTRQNKESHIDASELSMLAERAQRKVFATQRSNYARDIGYKDIDIKLVHAAVLSATIDGLPVTQPIGFKGRTVSLTLFNAFAPLVVLGAIQSIAAELECSTTGIIAQPYALSRGLHLSGSYLLIDIGGGTTDIALMRDGLLTMRVFAIGGNAFTRRISQHFSISFSAAEELKLSYVAGKITGKKKADIQKLFHEDITVWQAAVELALLEIAGSSPLPRKVFLCGGASFLPEIKRALTDDAFTSHLPFSGAPAITHLAPDDISGITDDTHTLTTASDVTPLALAAMQPHLTSKKSALESMIEKTTALFQK